MFYLKIYTMKIKSFCIGLANGITSAYEKIDEQVVKEIGDKVVIHSVTDTVYYQSEITKHNDATPLLPHLIRVVVYD